MRITTKGLVLKSVKLREVDQILTLLTPDEGILSVSAKGSLRPNNKLFSASGLFCYSEWTLFKGKTMYQADETSPIEVFFGLRSSIEAVSVAAYIAELLQIFSPTGSEASRMLKLALNSFHMLAEAKMPPALVKTVFELRSLSESGFMPDLVYCAQCGKYEDDEFFFDVREGNILCGACAGEKGYAPNLDRAALAALRHIVLAEDEKVFSFTLKGAASAMLSKVAERYLENSLDYPPKTLVFLKTILNEESI